MESWNRVNGQSCWREQRLCRQRPVPNTRQSPDRKHCFPQSLATALHMPRVLSVSPVSPCISAWPTRRCRGQQTRRVHVIAPAQLERAAALLGAAPAVRGRTTHLAAQPRRSTSVAGRSALPAHSSSSPSPFASSRCYVPRSPAMPRQPLIRFRYAIKKAVDAGIPPPPPPTAAGMLQPSTYRPPLFVSSSLPPYLPRRPLTHIRTPTPPCTHVARSVAPSNAFSRHWPMPTSFLLLLFVSQLPLPALSPRPLGCKRRSRALLSE